MSTIPEYGYDYVLALASKLTPEEQERLFREMNESPKYSATKKEEIEIERDIMHGEPIFSEKEKETFRKNRERFEASIDSVEAKKRKERLIQLALECPVATDEEIERQNEIRRAFEQCRLP